MIQWRAHVNQRRFVDNKKTVMEAVWNLDCERVRILRIKLRNIDIMKKFAARIFDNKNFNIFFFCAMSGKTESAKYGSIIIHSFFAMNVTSTASVQDANLASWTFFACQLKHEIVWETFNVTFDLSV